MEALTIIGFISMTGVLLNFGLQAYWFHWSTKVQERKHFTDEANEMDRIKSMFDKEEARRKKAWEEFIPTPKTKIVPAPEDFPIIDFNTDVNLNAHLKKDEEGKFNPDEVSGKLDGFFTADADGGTFK